MICCYHTYNIIIKFFFAKSFTLCKTTQTTAAIFKFFKTIISIKSRSKTVGISVNLRIKTIAEIEPSIFYEFCFNSITIATCCGQVATALC